jgi:phage I-like protein
MMTPELESILIALQAVDTKDDYQMILPKGQFHTRAYGKMDMNDEFLGALVTNWQNKVLGERAPYIDTEHRGGPANGWIQDLQQREDGLYAKIDWTELGRENVSKGYYKYFSSSIGSAIDPKSGEEIFPVLIGATLTNSPVMNMMPPAHLSEKFIVAGESDASHSEGDKSRGKKEFRMDFKEVLDAIAKLSDEQRAAILKALGVEDMKPDVQLSAQVNNLTVQLESFKDANKLLSEQLKSLQSSVQDKHMAEVLDLAEREGRILKKDREVWQKRLLTAPKEVEEIIHDLPAKVDFSTHGHTGGGEEHAGTTVTFDDGSSMTLSDEDMEAAQRLNQSPEVYAATVTHKKLPAKK